MAPGNNLTVSRINRLLRPLRNKCTTLALAVSQQTSRSNASQQTYSLRSNTLREKQQAPLTLVQPPEMLQLTFDSAENLELSRKIYAVRDCFRNVIQVTFGERVERAVPSLGALCSMVIGANVEPDVPEDEECDDAERDELAQLVEEIYETVPVYYRKWTLVSHALTLVLDLCPYHPTLLTILLETCLSRNLMHESTVLLQALLAFVLSTSPNSSTPPICNSTHGSYLIDLRALWYKHDQPDQTFLRVLIDVMVDASCPAVWYSSRAVARLAQELFNKEFEGFVQLVCGLSEGLDDPNLGMMNHRKNEKPTSDKLRETLTKWVLMALNRLSSKTHGSSSSSDRLHDIAGTYESEYDSIANLLCQLRARQYHLGGTMFGVEGAQIRSEAEVTLSGAIVSLAAHCLRHSPGSHSPGELETFVLILEEANMVTTSFDPIVSRILGVQEDPELGSLSPNVEMAREALSGYAVLFRKHLLTSVEASLWACTLRLVEGTESEIGVALRGSFKVVDAFKRELIGLVEDAEVQSLNRQSNSIPSSSKTPLRKSIVNRMSGLAYNSDEWEWEDFAGCWVRKCASPAVKRVKFLRKEAPANGRRSRTVEEIKSLFTPHKKSILRPTSRHGFTSAGTELGYDDEDEDEDELQCFSPLLSRNMKRTTSVGKTSSLGNVRDDCEKENQPNFRTVVQVKVSEPPPSVKRKRVRRSSNFVSLVGDSLSNHTVLHPRQKIRVPGTTPFTPLPSKLRERQATHSSPTFSLDHGSSPARVPPTPTPRPTLTSSNRANLFRHSRMRSRELPSDDLLDLFACSSPSF